MQTAAWTRSCLTAALALWLGACSQLDSAAHGAHRHAVVGDDRSVRVSAVGNELHARPFADEYCESLGKVAQFRRLSTHRLNRYASAKDAIFDCVPSAGAQNRVTG